MYSRIASHHRVLAISGWVQYFDPLHFKKKKKKLYAPVTLSTMLVKELLEAPWAFLNSTASASNIQLSYFMAPLIAIIVACFFFTSKPNAPCLNPRGFFDIANGQAKKQFLFGLRSMLKTWFDANPHKPASVFSDIGPMTVLPPSMANEIRSDPRLSFVEFSAKVNLFWEVSRNVREC